MLIKLSDHWYVDASLVSAVTYQPEAGTITACFHGDGPRGGSFKAPESEVERIVNDVNRATKCQG